MDGSLWMESHLKADGPKCVVLAFLCCPDPYYCLILDSQFSLFFLFFGLWFDWIYVVSCVLAESEGGVLIFECNQEYTNDPQWFSVLCLEKGQYNTPWSISFQGKTKFSMASCFRISLFPHKHLYRRYCSNTTVSFWSLNAKYNLQLAKQISF